MMEFSSRSNRSFTMDGSSSPYMLVRLGVADVTQHLIGILNDRWTLVRAHRCNLLTHIGNLAGDS